MTFPIKILLFSALLFTADKFFSQTNKGFAFTDQYKNHISLWEWQKYPNKIDTTFFKENFNGLNFFPNLLESDKRYNIIIVKVASVKAGKKYMIEIVADPKNASIEEIIGSQGHSFYLLKTKTDNKKLKVDSIVFDHAEI